jgi:hypothetical protein
MLFVIPTLFLGVDITHNKTFTTTFTILSAVIVMPIAAAAAVAFIGIL